MDIKVIASNRRVRHDYEILETHEAGLVLRGSEIKSIRAGHISIKQAFIRIDENLEAWLVDAHIAPYDPASRENHDPTRPRKLLLQHKQIAALWDDVRQKGLTIVPTQVHLRAGRAKVEIALVRGKRKYDKRQAIMKREMERETERWKK
ncbi:MAG TPA: SsrA-binding protein SmpB [Anaerolineales bacterium]|nr:SsrA-binding protein SmpB [Anaerolineales bacterium]